MRRPDDVPVPLPMLIDALGKRGFALAICLRDGRIEWASESWEEFLGYTRAELLALTHWAALLHPDERDRIQRRNADRAAGLPAPTEYDTVFRRKDGVSVPVEVAIQTLQGGDQDARFLAIARDITVRKSVEVQVARLAAIVASASDAVVSIDRTGTITSWNPGAEQVFGFTAGEMLGTPAAAFASAVESPDYPMLFDRVLGGETIHSHESVRRRRDGTDIHVSVSAAPMVDESGRVGGVSAIFRDVSQRVRADDEQRRREEAERSSALATEASRQKSAFLSRVSHELRTPLNSILGFGQLLQFGDLDDEQRDGVDHIVRAGDHLLALIDEVLDIAQLEAGEMRLSLEPVDVREVTVETVGMMRPLADRRNVHIEVDTDQLDVHVRADRQRLKQVLLNLLANAVKYNRVGGAVHVRAATAAAPDRFRLDVSDTGPGMTDDALTRLFQPFERLGAERSDVEGAGLGLALTRQLIEAMAGEVGVTSREGDGSTFWVEFARVPPDDGAVARPTVPTVPTVMSSPPVRAARRAARVLYIEDNQSNVKLMERLIGLRPGITLMVAMQGRLGLELAFAHQPDLVLLDLHLPDLTGEDVLRQLRADPRTAGTPVVILSADATPDRAPMLLALGASDYLTKPISIPAVLGHLDTAAAAATPRGAEPDAVERPSPAGDAGDVRDGQRTVAQFAHDLLNVLGVILNYCTLVDRQVADEQTRSDIDKIRAATQRAVELTRDIPTA